LDPEARLGLQAVVGTASAGGRPGRAGAGGGHGHGHARGRHGTSRSHVRLNTLPLESLPLPATGSVRRVPHG